VFATFTAQTEAVNYGQTVPMLGGAKCPRGAGLASAEGVGVIEIDLPDGVRVYVDGGVNKKVLRRVLSALRVSG
jgi:hypothetical protein